jgi:biopolymer transport protein ExbD
LIEFRRKSNYRGAIALNLTSLIDVLFLLVIFFLLTTKFVTFDSINLNITTINNSKAVSPSGTAIVIVLMEGNKFMLSGKEYKIEELTGKARQIMAENKNYDVALVTRPGITVQNMVTAMDKLRASGAKGISLSE